MTSETADTLGAHRVAFVCHGGGADLGGLEGLFDFLLWIEKGVSFLKIGNIYLEVCEETNVSGDFMRSGSERGERGEDIRINLSRVSLRSNRVGVFEPRELGDSGVASRVVVENLGGILKRDSFGVGSPSPQ